MNVFTARMQRNVEDLCQRDNAKPGRVVQQGHPPWAQENYKRQPGLRAACSTHPAGLEDREMSGRKSSRSRHTDLAKCAACGHLGEGSEPNHLNALCQSGRRMQLKAAM